MPRKSISSEYYPSNQLKLFLENKSNWNLLNDNPKWMLVDCDTMYCRILVHLDRIDFGIRKGFDRWANSTEFYYIIKTYQVRDYADAFNRAEYAYSNNLRKEDFEQICLNSINMRRIK